MLGCFLMDFGSILDHFGDDFEVFLEDFGRILEVIVELSWGLLDLLGIMNTWKMIPKSR